MEIMISIGILGAPINNKNLGCQALTYSLINMLEKVGYGLDLTFKYYIFEEKPDVKLDEKFCDRIHLQHENLFSVRFGNYRDLFRRIRRWKENRNMESIVHNCAFVIDLTEGDSFTDIYGRPRFISQTAMKEMVETIKPLILGSQTYGPFKDPSNENRAADVIKKATAVFTRDRISEKYVKKISGVDPILTCDLAFRLPYKSRSSEKTGSARRIGFNVSGLLVSDKKEGTATEFTLKTNYDEFVKRVLDYLISHQYEVYLIGHVAADYTVNKILKEKYPSVILAPEFDNPMDAKSYISSMDLFIGSRMHATIAALTSNTPVVPVAYSRKFTGLFENVDYPYIADLQTEDTNEAVQAVIDRIENYDETKIATEKSYQIAMGQTDECLKAYETVIRKVLSNR